MNLVLPKTQQIEVKPTYNLSEDNSSFSIVCIISANSSNTVEFLFRSKESKQFESVANVSSEQKSQFTWVATLFRKTQRQNQGEYACHSLEEIYSKHIDVIIHCMILY